MYQIIFQNDALDVSISKKGHQRSKISEKVAKGQLCIYIESMQIIYKNEPLDLDFSQKLVSRSGKVIRGQNFRIKVKKLNFWSNTKSSTCMFPILILSLKNHNLYFSWKNFIHCDDVCYQFGHNAGNRIWNHVHGGQTETPNN